MRRSSTHFSVFLLAALAPVLLQQVDCSTAGNASLSSLEVETTGLNRVIGFRSELASYTIGTSPGIDTITIRAQTVAPGARVNYRLMSDPILSGLLGFGGGETDLTIPVDTPVTLMVDVSDGGTQRSYTVDINVKCHTTPCDDGNSCSVDECAPVAQICEFTGVANTEPCEGDLIVDGLCNAGRCESTARLVDFESFAVDDQDAQFGLDIDRYYGGFDWANDDPAQIENPICTVAPGNPPTCWGSWAVDDVGATGVAGAGGSENWIRARASGIGDGSKISQLDGFVFRSMMLFTRDRTSYPAFVEEITVTTRDINDVDVTTIVSLQAETWIEVSAADLGLSDSDILKAIWFNPVGINVPDSGEFGLDDFKVALD